jgi:hypothetical protein
MEQIHHIVGKMFGVPHDFIILHVIADPLAQDISRQRPVGRKHTGADIPVAGIGTGIIFRKVIIRGALVEHRRDRPALPLAAGMNDRVNRGGMVARMEDRSGRITHVAGLAALQLITSLLIQAFDR